MITFKYGCNNIISMNTKKINNKRISGYVMAILGFLMILYNAINYIFDLDMKNPAFIVMGIVFVVIGMGIVKNNKS